jgi:hypothetical protein
VKLHWLEGILSQGRKEIWLVLIVFGLGLLLAAIPALKLIMKATATILHPKPQDAPMRDTPGRLCYPSRSRTG